MEKGRVKFVFERIDSPMEWADESERNRLKELVDTLIIRLGGGQNLSNSFIFNRDGEPYTIGGDHTSSRECRSRIECSVWVEYHSQRDRLTDVYPMAHAEMMREASALVREATKAGMQFSIVLPSSANVPPGALLLNEWDACSPYLPLESIQCCSVAPRSTLLRHRVLKRADLIARRRGFDAGKGGRPRENYHPHKTINPAMRRDHSSSTSNSSSSSSGNSGKVSSSPRITNRHHNSNSSFSQADGDRSRHQSDGWSKAQRCDDKAMSVQFEHDRKQAMIRFQLKRCTAGTPPTATDEIRLEVKYASIQHLFFQIEPGQWGKNRSKLTLTFRLRHPPFIYQCRGGRGGGGGNGGKGTRVVSWDSEDPTLRDDIALTPLLLLEFSTMGAKECSQLLGRLRSSLAGAVPFESRYWLREIYEPLPDISLLRAMFSSQFELAFAMWSVQKCGGNVPLEGARKNVGLYNFGKILIDEQCRATDAAEDGLPPPDSTALRLLNDASAAFDLIYALEALLHRGTVVTAHLRSKSERESFLSAVMLEYSKNQQVAVEALERLLNVVDERVEIPNLLLAFQRQIVVVERDSPHREATGSEKRSGYVMLRKVLITPSRVLPYGRERIMGNMALRFSSHHPVDHFLRVVVRDEDGDRVWSNACSEELLRDFFGARLAASSPASTHTHRPLELGGRSYNFIGNSNSQMRDHGCYFLYASIEECNSFRRELGQFHNIPSVPKMMARLGQCFTQASLSTVDTSRWRSEEDYCDGLDSNGKPFIFSDGCGSISHRAARHIADKDLKLRPGCALPACFQFRSPGFKGVLQVDPRLDEEGAVDVVVRPSQEKFKVDGEDQLKPEIVKHSSPVPVYLNKPLINILDQASAMQSTDSHNRICARIETFMERQVFSLLDSMIDEDQAKHRLGELVPFIHYRLLANLVNFTCDPFFLSILRASARVSISKLRNKHSILVPPSLGRTMFGVVDTTGRLEYGQVFVQWSRDVNDRCPSKFTPPVLQLGRVLVTKNPCISVGDVRVFEAVDVPELHHLRDVIVFPNHGHRPHPHEMAGSDLDGDEYVVIWDEELLLDHNEEAVDYTVLQESPQENGPSDMEGTHGEMGAFLLRYMRNDTVGRIATAHLCASDLYGIESEICRKLAQKHMQAVDFPKTGKMADQMINRWNGVDEPPETHERAPDFKEYEHEPSYKSRRLNGRIFREVKTLEETIMDAIEGDEAKLPKFVSERLVAGAYENYLDMAAEHYTFYEIALRSLMSRYNILSEGELFSGSYYALRNTLSERENDNMSFYTTNMLIEEEMKGIWMAARRRLFECIHKGTFESLTTTIKERGADGQRRCGDNWYAFNDRVCNDPSEELKGVASAYYLIAYGQPERKFLSFAWLAFDILATNYRYNTANLPCPSSHKFTFAGVADRLSEEIAKAEGSQDCKDVIIRLLGALGPQSVVEGSQTLFDVVCTNGGLDLLLYTIIRWAANRLSSCAVPLLARLVVKVGSGALWSDEELRSNHNAKWLSSEESDLREMMGGLGQRFIDFIRLLASKRFRVLVESGELFPPSELNGNPTVKEEKELKQWMEQLGKAAANSYRTLAFTGELDDLPGQGCNAVDRERQFTIEVPKDNLKLLEEDSNLWRLGAFKEMTGCVHATFRRQQQQPMLSWTDTHRVIVTVVGNRHAIRSAEEVLSVTAEDSEKKEDGCTLREWTMNTLIVGTIASYEKATTEWRMKTAKSQRPSCLQSGSSRAQFS